MRCSRSAEKVTWRQVMSSANSGRGRQHVYAILRVDNFRGLDVPVEHRITVKKIVWSEAAAKAEVERLNRLQADKDCFYFQQVTRLDNAPSDVPESMGSAADPEDEKTVKQ